MGGKNFEMQIKDALKFDNCKNLIPSRASKLGTQPATYFDKSYYFNQWENVFIPTSSNNSETYGSKVYWRLLLYLCIFLIFQHQTTLSPVVQGSNLPKLVQSLRILQGQMKTKSVLKTITISQFLLNQVRSFSII